MNASEQPLRPGVRKLSSASRLLGSSLEMELSRSSAGSSRRTSVAKPPNSAIAGFARHTFGLLLLLVVVFFWTASSFLGSTIFADGTYAKPFFLTYFNTTCFMLSLIPVLIRSGYQRSRAGNHSSLMNAISFRKHTRTRSTASGESQAFLKPDDEDPSQQSSPISQRTHLGIIPTARLSLMFCILWFSANYFAMACLQHTTVASTTILTSTSSIWTLLIGAFTHTEKFTIRKLLGVLASFVGIVLVSHADLTATSATVTPTSSPPDKGGLTHPFPTKPASELFFGDALAFFSAIIYGFYTIILKRTTLRCAPLQLNMPLFFGLVGVCNTIILFPLFPILHYTGIERFQLPPTRRIWTILMINSASSLFSDICWAYAMLLTSPLVVTVGLSLTIPLSLVGEMVLQGRTEGLVYWVGALIVVGSFVFVDREEVKDEVKIDTEASENESEENEEPVREGSELYATDGDYDSRPSDTLR